jgi:hypothetical protein
MGSALQAQWINLKGDRNGSWVELKKLAATHNAVFLPYGLGQNL